MPRVIDADRCPHCKGPLERPLPRSCPACGGSLQKRYLTAGCLTSKPLLLLFSAGALWLLAR